MSVELSEEIDRLLDEILVADSFRSKLLAERVLVLVEQAEAAGELGESEAPAGASESAEEVAR